MTEKTLNVQWTNENGRKCFAFYLNITRETKNYVWGTSPIYGDKYKLCKYTNSLEVNGEFVGICDEWGCY